MFLKAIKVDIHGHVSEERIRASTNAELSQAVDICKLLDNTKDFEGIGWLDDAHRVYAAKEPHPSAPRVINDWCRQPVALPVLIVGVHNGGLSCDAKAEILQVINSFTLLAHRASSRETWRTEAVA